MGGRVAERIVYGDLSTGASDDLQRNTELARKMVREWGMSDKIGPMAFGQQGAVFLGEDLMHSRDYSEDTSRVVDEEVTRILFEQEERATRVLEQHRAGLEAVSRLLLERESVDGEEVARIIDEENGSPVHADDDAQHFARGILSDLSGEPVGASSGPVGGDNQSTGIAPGALKPSDPFTPLP
jgi:cell division protease FtsH